jgi:hypothetical protein
MNTLVALYNRWDDVLAVIGAIFVALQAIVLSSATIAKLLAQLATYTQTKADDEFFAKLALALATAHDALNKAQRWLPRARLGKVKEPLIGTTIPPPPSAAAPPGPAPGPASAAPPKTMQDPPLPPS